MYQDAYDNWNRRATHAMRIEWRRSTTRAAATADNTNNHNINAATAKASTDNTEQNLTIRCITPTNNNAGLAIDEDLAELLSSFINPKYLDKEDLLLAESKDIRESIRQFGCIIQLKQNRKQCELVAGKNKDNDDLSNSGADIDKYVPFLAKYCCPFSKTAIKGFLQIALMLEDDGVDDILQLKKFGGSTGYGKRLVAVVPSTKAMYFHNNGKRWIPKLLDALGTDEEMNEYQNCYHLIKCIRLVSVEAFEDACRTLSSSLIKKRDPHMQIAATGKDGANMSYKQQRILRTYLIAAKLNILQPEHTIRAHEVAANIQPSYSSFREKKSTRRAWTLPLKVAINARIKSMLCKKTEKLSSSSFDTSPLRLLDHQEVSTAPDAVAAITGDNDTGTIFAVDFVLGADHGADSFKISVACNLRKVGSRRVLHHSVMLVAKAECRKDTRQVLMDSGTIKATDDGILETLSWLDSKGIQVQVYCSVDMAAGSLVLGKDSMSGKYCCRCHWRHGADCPRKDCQAWTLDSMKAHREKIDAKEQETGKPIKGKKRMGLKSPPLLNCVPIENYLAPVLHAVTLFTNTPFNFMNKWVWYRVEDLPIELIAARENKTVAALHKDSCQEMLRDMEAHLNAMRLQLSEEIHDAGMYNLQSELVESAEAAVKETQAIAAAADKELAQAKKHLKSLEDNKTDYGKTSQDVWMSIQRMLKAEFNVHPSSYHGGDMEGNQCRRLLGKATTIMARIESMLLEHLNTVEDAEERRRLADDAEVKLYCKAFKYIFQYMDLLSHYAYQPAGTLTDADMVDVRLCVDRLTDLWLNLMPTVPVKVHSWQHLVEDLEKLRGMKEYLDTFVEVEHQKEKKHKRRVGNLGDFKQKTESIMKAELTAGKRQVQEAHAFVESKRKRKMAPVDNDSRFSWQREANERDNHLRSILLLPPIEDDFPSLDELAKLQLQQEQQTADQVNEM